MQIFMWMSGVHKNFGLLRVISTLLFDVSAIVMTYF